MIKVIYAQGRKPGTTRDAFVRSWREHAGIAMMAADFWDPVRLYVQADALHLDLPEITHNYDGVGELHFESLKSREESRTSTSATTLVIPHGLSIFGSERPLHVTGTERVSAAGREARFKIYSFVRRHPSLSRAEFFERWEKEPDGSWLRGISPTRRGRTLSILAESEMDGIDEAETDTVSGLSIAPDHPGIVAERITIASEKVVLYRPCNFDEPGTVRPEHPSPSHEPLPGTERASSAASSSSPQSA